MKFHQETLWSGLGAVLLLSGLAMMAGCSALGYRLGSTLPPGIDVVHVPTVINRTSEPLIELQVTQSIVNELQREGTLSVADIDKADVVLNVFLDGFTLAPLRYESDQATATSEYRMTLRAVVELENLRTGEKMVQTTVRGEADFTPAGDLTSSKREILPKAADDLAQRIVQSVVEFW